MSSLSSRAAAPAQCAVFLRRGRPASRLARLSLRSADVMRTLSLKLSPAQRLSLQPHRCSLMLRLLHSAAAVAGHLRVRGPLDEHEEIRTVIERRKRTVSVQCVCPVEFPVPLQTPNLASGVDTTTPLKRRRFRSRHRIDTAHPRPARPAPWRHSPNAMTVSTQTQPAGIPRPAEPTRPLSTRGTHTHQHPQTPPNSVSGIAGTLFPLHTHSARSALGWQCSLSPTVPL